MVLVIVHFSTISTVILRKDLGLEFLKKNHSIENILKVFLQDTSVQSTVWPVVTETCGLSQMQTAWSLVAQMMMDFGNLVHLIKL